MPALILRLVVVALLAYVAGATVTPLVWAPVVARQAEETLSPFLLLSGGILLFGIGYVLKQFLRR
jgi:hypothetical protein